DITKNCDNTTNLGNNDHEINRNEDTNCLTSGYIVSTWTKQPVPILYLPWWDNNEDCISCRSKLKFTSDCQKYCSRCYIFYTGCRYCLTTNIIFGLATGKSLCKKCERKLTIITDTNILSGNRHLDDFLYDQRLNF